MEAVFLKILNMSIAASWIVLAVIAVRQLLKKAPKWITVLMWGLVGIRLVCPFSLESVFSLIPSAETVPGDILYTNTPTIHSGVEAFNSVVNPIISDSLAPAVGASVNPIQVIAFAASVIWIAGIVAMFIYTVVSYIRIYRKVKEAVPYKDNIWLCDHVDTPFILGVIRPKIYVPSAMSEQDMKYVIAHENTHLKRHDHWWKPLGFLLLTVYWFNPILWVAYVLLCRDIELACDEKVIQDMGTESKKPYSDALINCSVPRRMIAACPLAFGEVGVKGRVKSVLNYRKPAFWIIVAAIMASIVLAVCFLTDPAESREVGMGGNDRSQSVGIASLREQYPQYFDLDATNGLDVYVWQMAENSYSFGVLPHSDTHRDWISSELLDLRGTGVDAMRQILSTYHLDESDIHIIPWQNPISSYIGEQWIVTDGESIEEKEANYVDTIKDMLFGEQVQLADYDYPIYDSLVFDVDGDGIDEYCVLGYGQTSGLFTFSFTASEVGAEQSKYSNVFCTAWYDLSFVQCDDGVVRVQGIDRTEETHLFDISVVAGNLQLSEDGKDLNMIETSLIRNS
jgi:antirepressor regulating drug resistance, predicted signal transduction N-terminal membrane component